MTRSLAIAVGVSCALLLVPRTPMRVLAQQASSSAAGSGAISGTVTNERLEPIAGALVRVFTAMYIGERRFVSGPILSVSL